MRTSRTIFKKRLTREESRAVTREKLITVARAHFIRSGVGAAAAGKIAEDAGLSRGALYANFEGKEDLFLAVFDKEIETRLKRFRKVVSVVDTPSANRLALLQEVLTDQATNREWMILRAEFELEALRNEKARKRYIQNHRLVTQQGVEITERLRTSGGGKFKFSAADAVTALRCFMHGLTVMQKILGPEMPKERSEALVLEAFDYFFGGA